MEYFGIINDYSIFIGSLFALIGKIGSDAMSAISFIVSEDNISSEDLFFLEDKLKII